MIELPLADPGTPDTRSPVRFLLWCARGQLRTLSTGSFFGVVWMVSQAMIPLALGAALGAMVRQSFHGVVVWSLVVLGLGLLQAAAGVLRHRRAVFNFLICATRIQQVVVRRATVLGGDLARRVATGEVANIGASDIERVGDALDVVARFNGGVVSYTVVACVLLVVSPPLGLVVVLGVPVAVLAIAPVLKPFERRQTAERDRRTEASSVAADTVTGLRVLRGLGGEEVFARRYQRASEGVAAASMRSADMQAILDGAQVLLPGAIVIVVTWIGAHFALHHRISAGELVAFYASAAFLVIPMQTFVEAASKWTAAIVAARRIIGVLTLERADRADRADRAADGAPAPRRVPDGPLVDEATGTEIAGGTLTVVVPATPEEGTALLERLARWAPGDETTGVRWGGSSVDAFPLDWYRAHVVMLERSPFHLKGTVLDALTPAARDAGAGDGAPGAPNEGDGAGDGWGAPSGTWGATAATREALDAAEAADIVQSLAGGMGEHLPEQWRTLSGGQRQRLSLAQVLATGADVLLLDDPTSAVDAHTEAAIAARLASARRGRTTVVTSTSPLMAEHADTVVLLSGTALASGRHSELMAATPLYEDIVLRGGTR